MSIQMVVTSAPTCRIELSGSGWLMIINGEHETSIKNRQGDVDIPNQLGWAFIDPSLERLR
jgi:hypothetical protein